MELLLLAILGLCMGSFASAVLARLDRPASLLTGRSSCMRCEATIAWYDLVPVVSYAVLGGKCRACGDRISVAYPLLEIAMAAVWTYTYVVLGWSVALLAALTAVTLLVMIAVYDARTQLIPDLLSIPATLAAGIWGYYAHGWQSLTYGVLVGTLFFALQFLLSRGSWVGGGDIILGAAVGALLGWPLVLVGLGSAYILGAAFAVFMLASGRARRGDAVAFGPFLVLGACATLWWGSMVLDWLIR